MKRVYTNELSSEKEIRSEITGLAKLLLEKPVSRETMQEMSDLSQEFTKQYELSLSQTIFERVIQYVPNDIWILILSLCSRRNNLEELLHLREVSKAWNLSLSLIKEIHIQWNMPHEIYRLFRDIEILNVQEPMSRRIDLSSFTSLRELNIQVSKGCCRFSGMDSLLCLTSFAMQYYGYNDYTSFMLPTKKDLVTSLSLDIGYKNVYIKLDEFVNLERLVLGPNMVYTDISTLKKLSYLECSNDFILESNYCGYAVVTGHDYTYKGYIKNGIACGHGELRDRDGDYEGEFMDGEKHGSGKWFSSDGLIYQGNWVNNLLDGKVLVSDYCSPEIQIEYWEKGKYVP